MDFVATKNFIISLLTFAPVVVLAIISLPVFYGIGALKKRHVDYHMIFRCCGKAIFIQFLFLLATMAFFLVLYLNESIQGIPVVLLLPVSTLISFIVFVSTCIKRRALIYA